MRQRYGVEWSVNARATQITEWYSHSFHRVEKIKLDRSMLREHSYRTSAKFFPILFTPSPCHIQNSHNLVTFIYFLGTLP